MNKDRWIFGYLSKLSRRAGLFCSWWEFWRLSVCSHREVTIYHRFIKSTSWKASYLSHTYLNSCTEWFLDHMAAMNLIRSRFYGRSSRGWLHRGPQEIIWSVRISWHYWSLRFCWIAKLRTQFGFNEKLQILGYYREWNLIRRKKLLSIVFLVLLDWLYSIPIVGVPLRVRSWRGRERHPLFGWFGCWMRLVNDVGNCDRIDDTFDRLSDVRVGGEGDDDAVWVWVLLTCVETCCLTCPLDFCPLCSLAFQFDILPVIGKKVWGFILSCSLEISFWLIKAFEQSYILCTGQRLIKSVLQSIWRLFTSTAK